MRLLLITATLSIILQGFLVRSDTEQYNYADNGPDNLDEDENAESNSTVVEEPDLTGSDSEKDVEIVANTTVQTVLENTSQAEKKNDATLGPNECEEPPSIDNAVITSKIQLSYEVGAKVSYKCEFGYITDGAVPSSHCIKPETTQAPYWTKPELSCVPRSCGDPGFVDNAKRVGSVFTFPNKVSYECDEGYKLKGYGSRYCHASGRWSGVLPTCERVYCDPPSHPDNGRVIYSSLVFESELRYECNPGYILRNFLGRSCIGNGTWSGEEPVCQDTQCAQPAAPEFGFAQVVGTKTSVGTRVIYTCEPGRILKGSPTSKCLDTGDWTFPTPKCLDPCSVPNVNHGKMFKHTGYRNHYREILIGSKVEEKDDLILRCDDKYEVAGKSNKEEKIFCSGGEWSSIPECHPAQCRRPPPPTANANIGSVNQTHGGGVVYLCKTYFYKVKFGNVLCDFGTWKGETPVCKDFRCSRDNLPFQGLVQPRKRFYQNDEKFNPSCQSGYYLTKENSTLFCMNGTWQGHLPPCTPAPCYLENLHLQEGMASDNQGVVLNGMSAQVKCKKGFSRTEYQAVCSKGQFSVSGKLCKESNCIIHHISDGAFTKAEQKKKWKILGYDRWTEYEKIGLGRTITPGSTVHVSCDAGYSFQGKGWNDVSVRCSLGEWDKDPACLTTGSVYNKKAESSSDELAVGRTGFMNTTKGSEIETVQPVSTDVPSSEQTVSEDLKPAFNVSNTFQSSCYCTYTNQDATLAAYAGTDLLHVGSRVKSNCTVKFHCYQTGYARLSGPTEIQCQNCQWTTVKFPVCLQPQIGETTFQIVSPYMLLPGGIIGIEKGKSLIINCYSNGYGKVPTWRGPKDIDHFTLTSGYENLSSQYYNKLTITNIDQHHNGWYECLVTGFSPSDIFIQVINPVAAKCPKLEDGDFVIQYDNEQFVNSSAIFSCKGSNQKLVGSRVLTCMPNGQWSGYKPQCEKLCPEIPETEGMTITYTSDQSIGSLAVFHCFAPRVRTGVSRTTCEQNGEWKDPVPTCTLPTCLIDDLFKIVSKNVVPDMKTVSSENVPFNSTIDLTCEHGYWLSGYNKAKCGPNGIWEVSKAECFTGCPYPVNSQDSDLMIDPNRNHYRRGELVTLSCPSGQILSSEVVRLLCLNSGWSQSDLPHCINA